LAIEEVEDLVGVFFNTKFTARPGGKWDALLEVFHMEPVFDIDG
jgi:hypothetical protein